MILSLLGYALFPEISHGLLIVLLNIYGYWYVALIGQPWNPDYFEILRVGLTDTWIVVAISFALVKFQLHCAFEDWANITRGQRMMKWGFLFIFPWFISINLNVISHIPWLNVDLGGYEVRKITTSYLIVTILAVAIVTLFIGWQLKQLKGIGLLRLYLFAYLLLICFIVLTWRLWLPSAGFHMHHVALGLLLLPLTRLNSAPSWIFQGIALGIFIQGFAAFGFDPYLEFKRKVLFILHLTVVAIQLTLPILDPPKITEITPISALATWNSSEMAVAYSFTLNGVELYRGPNTTFRLASNSLVPGLIYFAEIVPIAPYGVNGLPSETVNFTTLLG